MKPILLLSLLFLLISCQQPSARNDNELQELRTEVNSLHRRLDSLMTVMTFTPSPVTQQAVGKPKSKKTRKSVTPASQSLYSSNTGAASAASSVSNYTPPATYRRSSSSSSSQCAALTKKGYRCSRRSRSGSYCWQHGG